MSGWVQSLRAWHGSEAIKTILVCLLVWPFILAVAFILELARYPYEFAHLHATGVALLLLIVWLARRRFRFNLRWLLVFTCVCAVAAWEIRKGRVAQAIDALHATGAYIVFDSPTSRIPLFDTAPRRLRFHATRLEQASHLDTTLTHLKVIPNLRIVEISGAGGIDVGLEVLTDLPDIEVIRLEEAAVTDRGIAHLRKLRRHREFRADSTQISDRGAAALSQITSLEVLVLAGSGISDRSIPALGKLRKLKRLGLDDSLVTQEGIAKLRQLLPGTDISNDTLWSRHERLAAEVIHEKGGFVVTRGSPQTVRYVWMASGSYDNNDFAQLAAFSGIQKLILGQGRLSDVAAAHLSELKSLEELHLASPPTEAGYLELSKLTRLKKLSLYRFSAVPGIHHLGQTRPARDLECSRSATAGRQTPTRGRFAAVHHRRLLNSR